MSEIPDRLLVDRVTIRRPAQSFAPGTKQPVFAYQMVAGGVPARFNPAATNMSRNVLGQTPKRVFRLFLRPVELKENYEVLRESDGALFTVTEVKDFFGNHLEAVVEEKR